MIQPKSEKCNRLPLSSAVTPTPRGEGTVVCIVRDRFGNENDPTEELGPSPQGRLPAPLPAPVIAASTPRRDSGSLGHEGVFGADLGLALRVPNRGYARDRLRRQCDCRRRNRHGGSINRYGRPGLGDNHGRSRNDGPARQSRAAEAGTDGDRFRGGACRADGHGRWSTRTAAGAGGGQARCLRAGCRAVGRMRSRCLRSRRR